LQGATKIRSDSVRRPRYGFKFARAEHVRHVSRVTDARTEDIHVVDDERFGAETVALVTGAASGIGRATAVALAVNGLTVAALDVDAEGLSETTATADEMDAPGEIHPVEADLTDDEAVVAAVDAAAELQATSGSSRTSPASSTSHRSRSSRWTSTTRCRR